MKREKLSKLRATLLTKGIQVSLHYEAGRSDTLRFSTRRGVVLFTVGVDDLFDGFGNRFDCDMHIPVSA